MLGKTRAPRSKRVSYNWWLSKNPSKDCVVQSWIKNTDTVPSFSSKITRPRKTGGAASQKRKTLALSGIFLGKDKRVHVKRIHIQYLSLSCDSLGGQKHMGNKGWGRVRPLGSNPGNLGGVHWSLILQFSVQQSNNVIFILFLFLLYNCIIYVISINFLYIFI